MSSILLENVFKTNGIPTFTFVAPQEYIELKVALRTKGRGVIIEGPSGIGKTTAVTRALEELGLAQHIIKLSGRIPKEVEMIHDLHNARPLGTVVIEDFHKLEVDVRRQVADLMKVLADEESTDSKIIIVGINKAGESLVSLASDLNNRIDVIPFEANPPEKVLELLTKGEAALNLELNIKREIQQAANGSFYLAQMLAHQACLMLEITEKCEVHQITTVSFEAVKGKVFDDLSRQFMEKTKQFARGTRLRPEGRAPYLHLLYWLGTSDEWTLSLDRARIEHPELKGSITQIAEKKYLSELIDTIQDMSKLLHYDSETRSLTVEDPQFVFFLRSLSWHRFAKDVGYVSISFPAPYDFALSFAGPDRDVALAIFTKLQEREFEVFYDKFEQHRIVAKNVEDYLRPIYQSDAEFVITLLSSHYPPRVWTHFEAELIKERFKTESVIPICFNETIPFPFDVVSKTGYLSFDRSHDIETQVDDIVNVLANRIREQREEQEMSKRANLATPESEVNLDVIEGTLGLGLSY